MSEHADFRPLYHLHPQTGWMNAPIGPSNGTVPTIYFISIIQKRR